MHAYPTTRHPVRLTQLLVLCIVVSFALAAMSIAYSAGRQSGSETTTVEVAPAR